MIGSIGHHDRLWNDVPCTVDELARVMTHVDDIDVTNNDESSHIQCPQTWEYAPIHEIDLDETLPLRFRVMVNHSKKVAFAAFRCTDVQKIPDVDLDRYIIDRSWTMEQVRQAGDAILPNNLIGNCFRNILRNASHPALEILADAGIDAYSQNLLLVDRTRPADPFESVEMANAYIQNRVKPWALRKHYTLVVGGYSLGGFIAQYVGYHQNLHNVSFDGLWGVTRFLPQPLNLYRTWGCATVVYRRDSVISWPEMQMGDRYQITPPDGTTEIQIPPTRLSDAGHSMAYFYDQHNPPQYSAELSKEDISAMYCVPPDSLDGRDLHRLHRIAGHFRNREIAYAMYLFYGDNPISELFRNAVYYQIYLIKQHQYQDVWELGMNCFNITSYTPQPYHSSTPQEQAQVIDTVLLNYWREARGQ